MGETGGKWGNPGIMAETSDRKATTPPGCTHKMYRADKRNKGEAV